MGQVALGFRSLLVRLAVFFVMAALLAWALGGTLIPRAETAEVFRVTSGEHECFWQIAVGGRVSGQVRWSLCIRMPDGRVKVVDLGEIDDVAGPLIGREGFLYAARRTSGMWEIGLAAVSGERTALETAGDRDGAVARLVELTEESRAAEATAGSGPGSAAREPASPAESQQRPA